MPRRLAIMTFLLLAALLLATCGGDDGDNGGSTSNDGGTSPTQGAGGGDEDEEDEDTDDASAGGGGDISEIDACSLLTRDEVEAAVGNSVEDGEVDFGVSCKWDSEPEETSVGVYFREIPGDFCEQALSTDSLYAESDAFSLPVYTSYNDAGGIGQADAVLCIEGGQMQLIVTGGVGVEPDEAALRTAAEDLTNLVLSRIE